MAARVEPALSGWVSIVMLVVGTALLLFRAPNAFLWTGCGENRWEGGDPICVVVNVDAWAHESRSETQECTLQSHHRSRMRQRLLITASTYTIPRTTG